MAGHEFNPQNDLNHFNILESQQLELLQAAGVKDAVRQSRKNALIIFNTVSFPQNVASLVRDEIPRKDQIPAAWEIRDGQVFAESFGTPEEVWENTRKYNPEQFNQKEKDAAMLGFKLLLTGKAKAVVYPMNDKNGIRYIPVLRRVGNTIVNESIDVGKVNRDLTTVEGGDVLRLLNGKHKESSTLVHDDKEFPLLVVDEAPTVTELQELALGRTLLTEQNPVNAVESIFNMPTRSQQTVLESNTRLNNADVVTHRLQLNFDDSNQRTKVDEIITSKKNTSNSLEGNIAETTLLLGNTIEAVVSNTIKGTVKTAVQVGQFLQENRRQRQKQKIAKPEKVRIVEPLATRKKKTVAQFIPRLEVTKVRAEKLMVNFRKQVQKNFEFLRQKPAEIVRKLILPNRKGNQVESRSRPKHETVKTNFATKIIEKTVEVLKQVKKLKLPFRKAEEARVLAKYDISKKLLFMSGTPSAQVKNTISLKEKASRHISRLVVEPFQKVKHKTRLWVKKAVEILRLKIKKSVPLADFRIVKAIRKPLTKILKEKIKTTFHSLKFVAGLVFIERVPKFIGTSREDTIKESSRFTTFARTVIIRINNLYTLKTKLKDQTKSFKKKFDKLNKSKSWGAEKILNPIKIKEKIKRPIWLLLKKSKKFWNYLALYIFTKPNTFMVGFKQGREGKNKPRKLESLWLSFYRWLVKVVSKRRENKILGTNMRTRVKKKKLPKSGVIFILSNIKQPLNLA